MIKNHSYIAALEERCALLESALLRADPENINVQDHLSSAKNRPPNEHTNSTAVSRSSNRGQHIPPGSNQSQRPIHAEHSEAVELPYDAPAIDLTEVQTVMPATPPLTAVAFPEMGPTRFSSSQGVVSARISPETSHERLNGGASTRQSASSPERGLQDNDNMQSVIDHHVNRLSMRAFAEVPYIGQIPGLSFAKLAGVSLRGSKDHSTMSFNQHMPSGWSGKRSQTHSRLSPTDPSSHMALAPDRESANILYRAAYLHVQSRYPFMQPVNHEDRRGVSLTHIGITSLRRIDLKMYTPTAAFFLWLVYAVGACHLSPGVFADSSAQHYFAAAMQYLDDVLAKQDILSIQALAMIAMYSFRAEDGPSVWHLVGFAMRVCIERGLHRRCPDTLRQSDPIGCEMRSRVFWSIYTLDRLVSAALGRPLSISDDEIDVEEPLDVDCFQTDPATLLAVHAKRDRRPTPTTSMSSACHWIRLYRIRSGIISRLKARTPMSDEEIKAYLAALQVWKDEMPTESNATWVTREPKSDARLPMLDRNRLLKGYYMKHPYLRQVAEAAAQCCELESQTVASDNPAHSMAALYSNFVSGLTLLHALATQRDILSPRRSARAIRACSSVLVAYATLFPEAQSFRIAFDDLVDGMEAEHSDDVPDRQDSGVSGDMQPTRDIQSTFMGLSAVRDSNVEQNDSENSDVWQKKVQDIGSMLQGNFQQDLFNLIANLGYAPTNPSELTPGDVRLGTPTLANTHAASFGSADPTDGNLELASMFDFAAYSSAIEQ
ncbi:hypothetical protein IAU59_000018 [Kwoniella sp. CBS 9459]